MSFTEHRQSRSTRHIKLQQLPTLECLSHDDFDICRMDVPNMFIWKVPLYAVLLSLLVTEHDLSIHQVYADRVVKWCEENSLNASAQKTK